MNCHIFKSVLFVGWLFLLVLVGGLCVVFVWFFVVIVRVALWFGSVGLERKLKSSLRIVLPKGCYLLVF